MYIQAILTTRTIQLHSYNRPRQKRRFLASSSSNNNKNNIGYVTRGQLLQQSKAPTKKKVPQARKKKAKTLFSSLFTSNF
jgi:hypothetical protein